MSRTFNKIRDKEEKKKFKKQEKQKRVKRNETRDCYTSTEWED